MKKLSFVFLFFVFTFVGGNSVFAHQETNASLGLAMATDPRPPIYRTFSLGKESKQSLHEMTLIIAWSPTLKGLTGKSGYQIWGDERILSKKQLTHSLGSLYESYADWGDRKPHLLVMGNDWAAGSELNSLMKKLSKEHSIDTFYYGASFAFGKIEFERRWPDLDKHALTKITTAIEEVLEPEQERK
ncbi:MAG: hypothetical protein CMA72_03760 [Euryarchaeota archaeon]|nr:hypothetical protein [Euryarchaeota archaeon]